jgi:small GTP-binding protein
VRSLAARLRESPAEIIAPHELGDALRTMDTAVSAYSDAMFAQALAIVQRASGGLPPAEASSLTAKFDRAAEAMAEQELESRKRIEEALRDLDAADKDAGGEARAIFGAAARAEQLLLSASLDAGDGDVKGIVSNLEELEMLIAAGTAIASAHKMKFCLLGEGAVGKSSLIRRYVLDVFSDTYDQTIGTHISSKVVALPSPDGRGLARVNLAVWDVMGHARLDRLLQSYLFGSQGAIIVFAVDSRESFASVDKWLGHLEKTVGQVPRVVMANKSDVPEKEVNPFEMMRLAEKLRCEVIPTSAKTGANVDLAFATLVRKSLARKRRPSG